MANTKAAKRYAKAFFGFIQEQHRLDPVHADVKTLRNALAQSTEFAWFIGNKQLAPAYREKVVNTLFQGKLDPLTIRFLLFLDEKKRLSLLNEILLETEALYNSHEGLLNVVVTSAQPLQKEEVTAMTDRLQTKFNKRIEPQLRTDPSLIGGFKIQVGDEILDYSIDTMLETLNRKLVSA